MLPALISLLSGASLTLSYAPFDIWWITPIALTVFFWCLQRSSSGFKIGWLFGLGWFGAGISWVHVSIADFGGLPLAGSIGIMLLLCAYLAVFPALAAWLLKSHFRPQLWPLAIGLIWVLTEWLRSWLLTGFPWLSLGYSQLHSPLGGWLPVVGETGVSAVLVILASALAVYLPQKRWAGAIGPVAVLLLGGWTLNQYSWVKPQGEPVNIALVQGNIKQELRWVPEQDAPTMQKYWRLSEPLWANNQVIIWPEAAIPKLEVMAQKYLYQLDQQASNSDTGVITGIVNYNFETEDAFNNMLALGKREADSRTGHYHYQHTNRFAKHHLLPIGEFIPLENWLRGIAPLFDLPMSSFTRGGYQQANLQANGLYFSPALCFEIAFPRQVRANLYPETDFIVTLSNDAWFGRSHGPAQHMQIAQVRAKEFAKPVIRATNNGITGFVDHTGKLQAVLPQFEDGVLEHQVQRVKGTTPYRYFGDWLIAILTLGLGIVALKLRNS